MAKQFSVIVNNNEYIFPSGNVRVVKNGELAFIEFNGGIFNTTSTIDEITTLANTGGTEQIKLTVVRLNDSMQVEPIPMSFPVSNITVNDSTLSGSYSVVTFKGVKYYVTETQEQILTVSNSGGGGSGDTPTLDEVLAEDSTITEARGIVLGAFEFAIGQENGGVSVRPNEYNSYFNALHRFFGLIEFNNRVKGVPRIEDDFVNDAAAEAGGIEINGAYHTAGACRIRIV